MGPRCEVCENFRPDGDLDPQRKLEEVAFGERKVLMCAGHARIAQNSNVDSFEKLRDFYRESRGKRSFVGRRSRAIRPETFDNRRKAGRRSTDA